MLRSIEGVYKDGRVELAELPPPGTAGRVIVTFVSSPLSTCPSSIPWFDRIW